MAADTRTILVVEDERIVAKDLQLTLIGFGYHVPTTAASSDDAIRAAAASCPDLVLMDIRIKGELDGIETAAILRRDFDIPVVYLTAYADDATLSRAKATSPHGYLVKPIKPEELRATLAIAFHRDEMDRRLREREHDYSTTLRSIGDAVIATDQHGAITVMNEQAELLVARRAEHVLGTPASEVVRLVDERTDGRVFEDRATPILDAGGTAIGVVRVFRDVTEHREAQQQLVIADRSSSLGTLAAGVAHEINNPLAVIVTNGELAASELEEVRRDLGIASPAELRARLVEVGEMVADMRQSADRVAKIVRDLRTFSRPHDDEPRAVDVRDALEWALQLTGTQARKRGTLVRAYTPVANVLASESRLGQLFVSLLVHAIHAMGTQICVATRMANDRIVVEVSHDGPTLPPEVCNLIFEPFQTRGIVGAGLELAVAHGLVRALGGTLVIEPAASGGMTLRVELAAAERRAPDEPARSTPRGHIVLVDDEPLLLSSLTRVLGRDHEVSAFSNPHAALERVTGRAELDLVLCDLIMPGLSGIDIYERVLEIAPGNARKFVFVTGGAYTTRGKEFLASVPNRCLEKPFGPELLRTFVREFLLNAPAA